MSFVGTGAAVDTFWHHKQSAARSMPPTHHGPMLLQVSELLTEVVPGCNLAELTALETILSALSQQGNLSVSALVHLLFQDMCHYFTKLQEHQRAERERRRKHHADGAAAAAAAAATATQGSNDTAAMDADAEPAAAAAAEGQTEEGLARTELIDGLRHVFALLSMLAAAQPTAIKEKYVQVLLEVAFSPDLAVSSLLANC